MLRVLAFLDETYRESSENKEYSSDKEHAHLSAAYKLEDESATCRSRDLREADSTVEQTEVCSDMAA